MAVRNIFKENDAVVRQKSRVVTVFDNRLGTLIDDMKETMLLADGCGLAAPQVGILKRVAIVWHDDIFLELVNPIISNMAGEDIATEGCLSLEPERNCYVKRPTSLTVSAQDRYGKNFTLDASGWQARIICHECDHLDGILFVDKKVEKEEEPQKNAGSARKLK